MNYFEEESRRYSEREEIDFEKLESLTCEKCGNEFKRPAWLPRFHRTCPPCSEADAKEAEEEQERTMQKFRQRWKELAPKRREWIRNHVRPGHLPRMETTDPRHPEFRYRLWDRVRRWNPTPEQPFLGIVGPTGTCKTRCVYLRQRQFLEESAADADYPHDNIEYVLTQSGFDEALDNGVVKASEKVLGYAEWFSGNELASLFSPVDFDEEPSQKAAKAERLAEVRNTRLLTIDDLCKIGNTGHKLGRLFDLIDYRLNHGLATIWTANSRPDDWLTGAGEEYGPPLARRLAGKDGALVIRTTPKVS